MIPSGVQIFVALEPIDMRFSFDRLSGLAKDQVGYDARGGALFVFFGKRRDALKVLFFDGSGMCVFYNQLSSHYTSFDRIRESSFLLPDSRTVRALSVSRSHRLQCFVGRLGGSS
jgi:transposase